MSHYETTARVAAKLNDGQTALVVAPMVFMEKRGSLSIRGWTIDRPMPEDVILLVTVHAVQPE